MGAAQARAPGLDAKFVHIEEAPPDPILNTATMFKEDTNPKKVNLGIGAYRTEQGKPYVLPVVMKAEEEILKETGGAIDKEYQPVDGQAPLKSITQRLVFGDSSPAMKEGRVASAQALSGTGSLRVVAEFIKTHLAEPCHTVYISEPTWGNHPTIFQKAGLKVVKYPYYNPAGNNLNIKGMMDSISSAPPGSTVLLHACAHNPTGIDPTEAEWQEIANIVKSKKLMPILDSAYQGYASGCLDKDAFSCRLFDKMGIEFFVCQSFAKNLGLYGERIGMVHVVCASQEQAKCVLSQLKLVIRPMYSSPPVHGALILLKVLGNPANFAQWKAELKNMADRILDVRNKLQSGLEKKGTPGPGGSWKHITAQIGMFSFTGLSVPQCERLISEHHIYLLKSGRISLAGLNNGNVQYVVDAIDEVIRKLPAK